MAIQASVLQAVGTLLVVATVAKAARLGTARYLVVFAYAGALYVAQTLDRPRLTYPLESWRMYSTVEAPRAYFSFEIQARDGSMRPYPFELLVPASPGLFRNYSMMAPITWRLVSSHRQCRCGAGDYEMDQMIAGLVRVYESSGPHQVSRFLMTATAVSLSGASNEPQLLYTWTRAQLDQ